MKLTPLQLTALGQDLRLRVRGQTEALTWLLDALTRQELETVPPPGPRGCFVFAGPTGVGKTETARVLAEHLFSPEALLRIDCSEYKTLDSLTALLGDTAGNRGRLGRAYDRHPEGLWLFDEIEKAHPELVQLFLQMVEPGRLTLTCGETLDLRGHYLILTTNLGSAEILGREHLTFTSLERHVLRCLERFLSPELQGRFNRYARPLVFAPLRREAQAEILVQRLDALVRWHLERGRRVEIDPEVFQFLLYRGFSPRLGARPLLAFIEEQVGNAVADDLMNGGKGNGTLVVEGDRLRLRP